MSKVGRNDPCPCGSGKKYKKCCMLKEYNNCSTVGVVHYSEAHEIIKDDFIKKGISIEIPGFYNQKEFIAIEKEYPSYLNNYARYIQTKNYSDGYIEKARREISLIASILHDELVKDGRKGACIDMSLAFSKILEKEGYWNYVAKGALTIEYPTNSGIPKGYFWPIDYTSNATAGHVWVVAPPFSVIDITIKQQKYSLGQARYLPDLILEQNGMISTSTLKDIIAPETLNILKTQVLSEDEILHFIHSDAEGVGKVFSPLTIVHDKTLLKYITTGISAPYEELKDVKSLNLNGMYAIDIYEKIIIPQLKKMREII